MLTFGEYSQAWDFRNTVAGQLQVDAYYNASKDPNAGNSSPLAVRVNQVGLTTCKISHTVAHGCNCVHLTAFSASLEMLIVTACFATLSTKMKLSVYAAFPIQACKCKLQMLINVAASKSCDIVLTLELCLHQGLNLATNAFLRWSLGSQYSAKLLAIMEMPKQETHLSLDFSSLLGPIFYCWLSQLLLPLLLVTLVYEKQRRSAHIRTASRHAFSNLLLRARY